MTGSNDIEIKVSFNLSFAGVLTCFLAILKIMDIINWSWWWVFSPLWIGFLLAVAFAVALFCWQGWRSQ